MSVITAVRLGVLAPEAGVGTIEIIAAELERFAPVYGVTTLNRRAYFLGEMAYESGGFARLVETLDDLDEAAIRAAWPKLANRAGRLAGDSQSLANAAYAFEGGNGTESSGDGWRFRGRGLVPLLGRFNYGFFGDRIGVDLDTDQDKAADPAIAARLALAFWQSRGCNDSADLDDLVGVTRRIDPKLSGMDQRRAFVERAKKIFT